VTVMIGVQTGLMLLLALLGVGLLALAILGVARPSPRASFALFKYASVYMLGAMLIVAL
jgi:hypothetical protein